MLYRLRILPVTMAAASLLLVVKVGDVWRSASAGAANAAQPAAERQYAAAESEPEATRHAADSAAAVHDDQAEAPAMPAGLASKDPALFTKSELELLSNLARRRDELEVHARELEMRENLLQATEKRIDEKIVELKRIESNIEGLLAKYDEAEEAQLKSLVKVYESMKPKDAARIFNRLEMDVLLNVVERMKEAKMAPVLAQMDPGKAKALTVELATRRQAPELSRRKSKEEG